MEERYWALAPSALEYGITKSQMGQLAKLCNDYSNAFRILNVALKTTTKPKLYVSKIIANLRAEQAPPKINNQTEPDVVFQARLRGWSVRKSVRPDGSPAWFIDGQKFDQKGEAIGG